MSAIKKIDREGVVAYKTAYAKIPGSDVVCAMFLSQACYWCAKTDDGVAWITHQAMFEQTGLSRRQQDRAIDFWVSLGIMEKFLKGVPPKLHYYVDFDALERAILQFVLLVQIDESAKLGVQKEQINLAVSRNLSSRDSIETHRDSYVGAEATEQQPEKAEGEATAQHLSDVAPALRSEVTVAPAKQKKERTAQTKRSSIPSLEEFIAWVTANHPGWEREAEAWHKRMASQDWINGKGIPILNAKSTFNTWKANGWIQKLPEIKVRKPLDLGY